MQTTLYTIIHSSSHSDKDFAASTSKGSFLTLSAAREELAKQISAEKARIPTEYDCEERGEDELSGRLCCSSIYTTGNRDNYTASGKECVMNQRNYHRFIEPEKDALISIDAIR